MGEIPEEGSGGEPEDGQPDNHPGSPIKRVDSPVRAEMEADQPPPESTASRLQLSPAPRKRHQLASPRSTEHHHRHLGSPRSTELHPQSSRDRGAHADPSDLASEAKRGQRALEDANQTRSRREARRLLFDEDIEQAKNAAREASVVAERARAHQAPPQSVASTAKGATAAPSPSTRSQGVASQDSRTGGDAFLKGSVACMASAPRIEFSSALATVVMKTAFALLTSERPASRHADALSVEAAWARMDCTPYAGQTIPTSTLALVKAPRMAHDEAPDPVFCPTPEEELVERNRGKKRRGDSRDRGDRTRGDGGSGGGGKNGGGGDHHHRRGGGSGDGGGQGASGTGDGSGRGRRGKFGGSDRGSDLSSGGGNEKPRNSSRGRLASNGSSTSSRSSLASSTDHGEVTVVAGNRRVTPSLMDVASSAKRLTKLTVSGEHTNYVSLDLVRARTSAIATAAATATATLGDSVKRAFVKPPHKDVARISVLPFSISLNKSDGAQQLTRSDRSAMADTIMRCDDRCTEGVRPPMWVTGWNHPLHMAFTRAIAPDMPIAAGMMTLTDDVFGQVS